MSEDIWKDPEFVDWFKTRPKAIQKLIILRPPEKFYWWKDVETGEVFKSHKYEIIAYEENEAGPPTLKVYTEGVTMPRQVFGVSPETLVEVT